VSKRKISNKRLSHNLKARKAPLHVLPMTTFHQRHQRKNQKKEFIKNHWMEENISTPLPPPPIPCTLDNMNHQTRRRVKKSWRMKPIIIKPLRSLRFSMNALRWIIVLIFLYLAAGTAIVMIQDGMGSLKNIVVYSIIGFFTFFMGYLGWILARDVLEMVSKKKTLRNDPEFET
jgi:hypothetical protein